MKLELSIEGTTNETAVTKFARNGLDDFDYNKELKKAVDGWFAQSSPRWFERDEIFHASGILLDKKTKVVVCGGGKKMDRFKLADCLNLVDVNRAATNFVSKEDRGVLAMENSDAPGVANLEGDMPEYDRSLLKFNVAVVSAMSQYDNLPAIQYYIVTGVEGFEWGGYDSSSASGRVLVDAGIFYKPPQLQYDARFAAQFRKSFLS